MKNEDLNNEVKALHSKLNVNNDNLNFSRNQVEDATRTIANHQVTYLIKFNPIGQNSRT